MYLLSRMLSCIQEENKSCQNKPVDKGSAFDYIYMEVSNQVIYLEDNTSCQNKLADNDSAKQVMFLEDNNPCQIKLVDKDNAYGSRITIFNDLGDDFREAHLHLYNVCNSPCNNLSNLVYFLF